MSIHPCLLIDLSKITHNTKTIVKLAERAHIDITGVTKATCGDPNVAEAMKDGGVISFADSRLQNIKQIKQHHPDIDCMLLRTPMISELNEVVDLVDISLNSERNVIQQISILAEKKQCKHKILLMVEMGDLREGMNPDEIKQIIPELLEMKGITLYGIGMNLACFGGVVPTSEKINAFCSLVADIEQTYDIHFTLVSAGNSANIPLLLNNVEKTRVNHLRIGEGILLGRETVQRTPIPDTYQDAFVLEAELIELKDKPSVPSGRISENAFGETPTFKEKGIIKRGIVAIGRQDVIVEDLKPLDDTIEILGSSSDHIILHIKNDSYQIGDSIRFSIKYGALVHLYTSPYVQKKYVRT
jgi:predicted amino acid racemase